MKKTKQTIETQLDCFATASLQEEIKNDMTKKDGSLASLLNDEAIVEDNQNEKEFCD